MGTITPSRLRHSLVAGLSVATLMLAAGAAVAQTANPDFRQRAPQDEIIYFMLPDRFANGDPTNDTGGIPGGKLDHGFDPTDEGFYHGGDLAGVMQRLDYIQGLGATAIWLAPIFKNKPVQGEPGREFSGAHGYWITDFTAVDPHFGDEATMKALVEAAHARGMKVYLDIVTNHTADVIQYRECPKNDCAYRSRADYPFTRRGGVDGAPINDGFDGTDYSRLNDPNYAYTPYVPMGEEKVKGPAWLNDPIYYHNRGDSTFKGESSLDGDFAGLDGLMTEHPQVVSGMIDIFGGWIDTYGIDGFRIDTARHVNPEFWQAFVPAMLERAEARGIPNFHIFGEVFDADPAVLSRFTRIDRFPAVLDFAFQSVVTDVVARDKPTDLLARLYDADANYEGGAEMAMQLPTFLGNHDMGRIGNFIMVAKPDIADDELLARTRLAHAVMMFTRGVPTLYYGDEQGFAGDGGYGGSRQDMFATQVTQYADDRIVGGKREPFDTEAPLYKAISEMAALRAEHISLRRGRQVVRHSGDGPGLFAVSRFSTERPSLLGGEGGARSVTDEGAAGPGFDRRDEELLNQPPHPNGSAAHLLPRGEKELQAGRETLIVFNTSTTPVTAQIEVEPTSTVWTSAHGDCVTESSAPGSLRVTVAPLDYMICLSEGAR